MLSLFIAIVPKGWSLTDCVSFRIMEQRPISEALTYDGHFE